MGWQVNLEIRAQTLGDSEETIKKAQSQVRQRYLAWTVFWGLLMVFMIVVYSQSKNWLSLFAAIIDAVNFGECLFITRGMFSVFRQTFNG